MDEYFEKYKDRFTKEIIFSAALSWREKKRRCKFINMN